MKLTHWEYVFGLHTCNLGHLARRGTNPFTGESVEFPIDNGLTSSELAAVKKVFDRHNVNGPEPDYEGFALYGSSGNSLRFRGVEFDGNHAINGMEVEIIENTFSDTTLAIVFDVAKAGNLALMSSVGDCVRIVDRPPDGALLARWPDAETISTVPEFRHWVQNVIGGRQVAVM
jgi:hypothetical protein